MKQHIENGSLHRFGDDVAIWIGEGETEYLDFNQAMRLKNALNKYIREMRDHVSFQDSKINTITFK